jgi:chitinase
MKHIWNCHNETSLSQQKGLFSKMENREIKQVLSGGWHQWEWGGYREKV